MAIIWMEATNVDSINSNHSQCGFVSVSAVVAAASVREAYNILCNKWYHSLCCCDDVDDDE